MNRPRGFEQGRVWIAFAALLAAATAPALAQQVSYSGAVQVASGDYLFTERTASLYVLNGLSVQAGRLRASASLPFIVQSTPFVSYGPAGAVPTGGPAHGSVGGGRGRGGHQSIALPDTLASTEAGVGDPSLLASIEVLADGAWWPSARLVGAAKAPVADVDRGFSTGAWDAGGGLSLAKALGPRLLFLDVMVWTLGDLPELELRDPLAYSVGLGQAFLGGRLAVLASFSGYTEIIEGAEPPRQATLAASVRLGRRGGLSGSLSAGLSESSPDVAATLGWHLALTAPTR